MNERNKNIVELVVYVIVGGLTTLVNFIVFFICTSASMYWFFANVISWVFAVLFAYITNRKFVFKSSDNDTKKEFLQFVGLRLVTLVIESALLFVCIQLMAMNENISKIIVSFVTVIGNYVFCKFLIFKPVKYMRKK